MHQRSQTRGEISIHQEEATQDTHYTFPMRFGVLYQKNERIEYDTGI